MAPLLFYFFAAMMLCFGVLVFLNRNPVASAFSLVVSFLGLAAIFIGLEAYLVGVIQVLVYAGAVMVLFLFIIMLLDIKAEELKKIDLGAVLAGVSVVACFVGLLSVVLWHHEPGREGMAPLAEGAGAGEVAKIGEMLFSTYAFHVQIVAVLLLVATIGVVRLSLRGAE
jgi:NADH-quinone oxidoreductase subunit J